MSVLAIAQACIATATAGVDGDVSAPPRVISLAPHLTELSFEAGIEDSLVGVVEWSDWPPAARDLPRIGDAFRFDLETILRLRATHALAWLDGTPPQAISRLEQAGIEVVMIGIRRIDDIGLAIERLGALAGKPETAATRAEQFRQRLAGMRDGEQPDRSEIPVFYQVSARPLFTLGGRHVINDVFTLCGARNIFAGLDSAAAAVEIESVLAADPLAIIAGRDESRGDPLERWRAFGQPRAVGCGNLLEVDPALLVRPTPRLLDGAQKLCRWLDEAVRQAEDPACRNAGD